MRDIWWQAEQKSKKKSVRCIWDDEACVWVAGNDYIPLTMESDS
ncbi:MAG: DUF1902 domain-containing protein [Lachnospiraceae bacterium]|nr:DUF1902 domain-containing protein [Lachnospiraceae bacterium]